MLGLGIWIGGLLLVFQLASRVGAASGDRTLARIAVAIATLEAVASVIALVLGA